MDGSMLCAFLSTAKGDHLKTLEAVALRQEIPVYATLSLAAARHYDVNVPSYVLFSNTTAFTTSVYRGNLNSPDSVIAFVRTHFPLDL